MTKRKRHIDFEDLNQDLQEATDRLYTEVMESIEATESNSQERQSMLRGLVVRFQERVEEYDDLG